MKNSTSRPRQSAASALLRRLNCAALALGLTGVLSQTAQAQYGLPFYEPFPASYTNGGTVITNNGVLWVSRGLRDAGTPQAGVWTWGGSGSGEPRVNGGAALSYPGLWQAGGSLGLYMRPDHVAGNRNAGIQLATLNSGKVYASFLLNVQTWPTNQNRMICQLNSTSTTLGGSDLVSFFISTTNTTTGTSNRVYVVKHGSSVTNEPPAEAPSITAGTTHLIVMRYSFDPADNDELAMWVDPGSLGVGEGSVPVPATTTTNGTDVTSFSTFAICEQNDTAKAGSSLFLDEIRIGTKWADVTPTSPPCTPVNLSSSPTNVIVVEGGMATFSAVAGGTSPAYQWQVSTDGGATWTSATAPPGFSTNAATFYVPLVTMNLNGNKYRCQVSVACGSGSVTNTTAATLTMATPTVTPPGVVLDDFFMKRDRLSGPVNSTNSQWFTDTTASLYENADPDPFMLVGTPQSGTSCLWLGYFAESNNPPVHLDVGYALKASLIYTCTGIAANTNSGIRMGLFDHYDAGIRLSADGTPVKNSGFAVRGYAYYQNWDTVFSDQYPQYLYARNLMEDASLLATTGDFATLGHSVAGLSNAPAFSDGTTYTMDLYVARMTSNRCSVCMSVSGGGTNYTTTAADRDYGYHRFDCIAFRPNNLETTAAAFDFSEFKVQVLAIPPRPTLNIAPSGSSVVLTWADPAIYAPFRLEQASVVTGPWSFVTPTPVSPYTVPTTNAATFFRLEWP